MKSDFDTADCGWCKGDGKDHGTLGMARVRECPRCEGSGRVFVTNRESATGRRRVYKGAAPKAGVIATRLEPRPVFGQRRDAKGRFRRHG
jgi:DnaJ-class molecular chaperone